VSIDSHGFQVMSLRELQERLRTVSEAHPELLDKPVWTENMHPVHFPVKRVIVSERGTHLHFERGGN
jgi:hypothetical protein